MVATVLSSALRKQRNKDLTDDIHLSGFKRCSLLYFFFDLVKLESAIECS